MIYGDENVRWYPWWRDKKGGCSFTWCQISYIVNACIFFLKFKIWRENRIRWILFTCSFCVSGASLTGSKMARRIGSIDEFEFKDIGQNHKQGVSFILPGSLLIVASLHNISWSSYWSCLIFFPAFSSPYYDLWTCLWARTFCPALGGL